MPDEHPPRTPQTDPSAAAAPRANETDLDPSALDSRKTTILRAVVAEHIATGQPVGSGHLSGATGLGVSSATIRNEMSVLERDGYLTHPHTSAGRVPTDKGYRFFVDSLGGPGRLAEPKVTQVRTFFDRARGELEQLLTETSRMLSSLTEYAAVVVGPAIEAATVRSVQVVGLGAGPQREGRATSIALVVAVLSNGVVEKETIEIPAEVAEPHLAAASAHLSAQLVGRTLASLAERPLGSLAPMRLPATGEPRVDAVCDIAVAALAGATSGDTEPGGVFVGGASRMASAFDAVDTIRRVLTVLEEQYVVVDLLREALDRSGNVSIGGEHGSAEVFQPLLTCSVVVAPYQVDGKPAGTIGVLGPTRMDYPQAMAAVTMVSQGLTERLSDG